MNYIYNLLKRPTESLMCIPGKAEPLSFIDISAYSDSQRQTIQSNRLPFDFLTFSDFFSLLF